MRARILLVMRHGNAKVVSEFLENEGYQVVFMEDVGKLIEIVDEERFDVVIIDVSEMPRSVWSLVMKLKEKDMRFIVVNKPAKKISVPAVTVYKPLSKAELLKVVEALL